MKIKYEYAFVENSSKVREIDVELLNELVGDDTVESWSRSVYVSGLEKGFLNHSIDFLVNFLGSRILRITAIMQEGGMVDFQNKALAKLTLDEQQALKEFWLNPPAKVYEVDQKKEFTFLDHQLVEVL